MGSAFDNRTFSQKFVTQILYQNGTFLHATTYTVLNWVIPSCLIMGHIFSLLFPLRISMQWYWCDSCFICLNSDIDILSCFLQSKEFIIMDFTHPVLLFHYTCIATLFLSFFFVHNWNRFFKFVSIHLLLKSFCELYL